MKKIAIHRQGWVSFIGDCVMLPVMYFLQGTLREVPQRTHRWNNTKMHAREIAHFSADHMVTAAGDEDARRRWFGIIPLFHMPIFGGWSEYVVIAPVEEVGEWFVGWLPFDTIGISNIPLTGPVRLLVGPRQVQFFGLDADGNQLPVHIIGSGVIGQTGEYRKYPLL